MHTCQPRTDDMEKGFGRGLNRRAEERRFYEFAPRDCWEERGRKRGAKANTNNATSPTKKHNAKPLSSLRFS
ncbi:hypothetical protein VNO78_10132 [Psophocarpus tetragonolobus]|uniref:Uncharacterized protein n=1 Tax=Psophocarpus tetragonolobus TaxID=3891 RepID=A0AAN9SKA3_PSOTE